MKYLSIDIETTGVDSENDQILSIGIIVEDTTKKLPFEEIPKFHCAIVRNRIEGNLFALNMNRDLLQAINFWTCAEDSDEQRAIEQDTNMVFLKEDEVVKYLFGFLHEHSMLDKSIYGKLDTHVEMRGGRWIPTITLRTPVSQLNVAGKNFGTFDKLFLEKLPQWNDVFKVRQRIIDPTILFTNWNEDEQLPNLTKVKERANVGGEVTHDAIEDAWDIIQVLRTQY